MAKEEKKENAEAKPELSPEELAAKAKKRRLLIFIIAGVVLIGGISGGLFFFLAGSSSSNSHASGDSHVSSDGQASGEEVKADAEAPKAEAEHAAKKPEGDKGAEKKGEETKKGDHAQEKAAPGTADAKAPQAAGANFGCTMKLAPPFHLNLGNPLENRYIRLELTVEHSCTDQAKNELEQRMPQLRDVVISVTSRRTREFLLSPDGKDHLRKELLQRINEHMTNSIQRVFITDILIE